MSSSRGSSSVLCPRRVAPPSFYRAAVLRISASSAAGEVASFKIGTRGSPLALAQAYMTRDLLKVSPLSGPGYNSAFFRLLHVLVDETCSGADLHMWVNGKVG